MQRVDVDGARGRLAWTPRADLWLPFHQATLK
jgi:hypothetical protein